MVDVKRESIGLLILQGNAFKIILFLIARRKKTTDDLHFSSEKTRAGQGSEVAPLAISV